MVARLDAEPVQLAVDREEHVLRDIEGFLSIAQNSIGQAENHGIVTFEQLVKSFVCIGAKTLQQRFALERRTLALKVLQGDFFRKHPLVSR